MENVYRKGNYKIYRTRGGIPPYKYILISRTKEWVKIGKGWLKKWNSWLGCQKWDRVGVVKAGQEIGVMVWRYVSWTKDRCNSQSKGRMTRGVSLMDRVRLYFSFGSKKFKKFLITSVVFIFNYPI